MDQLYMVFEFDTGPDGPTWLATTQRDEAVVLVNEPTLERETGRFAIPVDSDLFRFNA